MKIQRFNYNHDIHLYNIGDVHYGDNTCNVSLVRRIIEVIRNDPKAIWLSTGDILNVALKTSKSDSYKSMPLGQEWDEVVELFEPIVSKCVGIIGSNHHQRFERAIGMNLDKLFCTVLGIPYLGISSVINLTAGRCSYFIALHHGNGGGAMRGAKTMNLEKLARIYPGCDVYLQGHTHAFEFFINQMVYVDRKRNNLVQFPAYFCTGAHFLNWTDSYAEEKGMPPMPQGAAVVHLKGSNIGRHISKSVKVDLFF